MRRHSLIVLFFGVFVVSVFGHGLAWSGNLKSTIFMDNLVQDTWNYLSSDLTTTNHLPWSWFSETLPDEGDYCNPAEIGLRMLCWIGAFEMKKSWSPEWSSVESEVSAVLDQLRAWQTGTQAYQPHGPNAYLNSVFYQWYWVSWDPPVVGNDAGYNQLVPSIDNAWLASCLITIREYGRAENHPVLTEKAGDIVEDMDFMQWYNPQTHRFYLGAVKNPKAGVVADYYSNENRIINFVARALGQLSSIEFRNSLDALTRHANEYNGVTVQAVAWDGALFTYLTPALFIKEIKTSYHGRTILPAIRCQINYAEDQGYTGWGLSDCFDIGTGAYIKNQGAPPLSKDNSDPPEGRPGLIAPYSSALALITSFRSHAVENLESLVAAFPSVYDNVHPFGFRDSVMGNPVDLQYGAPSDRFSELAQSWIFLSIVNDETQFIWKYFYKDKGVATAHREMYGTNPISSSCLLLLQ